MRGQLFKAAATLFAGKMQTEAVFTPLSFRLIVLDVRDAQDPMTKIQRRFHGIRQATSLTGIERDAVDDDIDNVLSSPVHLRHVFQAVRFPIDPNSSIALLFESLPQLIVGCTHCYFLGSQQQQSRPGGPRQQLVDDLISGLSLHGDVARRTIRLSYSRKQNTQVVVYLGHRANRRPG